MSLKILWKNLKFLSKRDFSLYDNLKIEDILYFIHNSSVVRPLLKNFEETITDLTSTNKSLIRFGDGELSIIKGHGCIYQKYEKELAEGMKNILKNNHSNIMIGINYEYFYPKYENKNFVQRNFLVNVVPHYRNILLSLISLDKVYYTSSFTGIPDKNQTNDMYDKLRILWNKKKVVIVGCKEAKSKLKYNIFDNASKEDYVYCQSKNCFSQIDELYSECLEYPKNTIVIIMAGPCGKILAYRLIQQGYRCLDLGHIAKSYDFYKKKLFSTCDANVISYYEPD